MDFSYILIIFFVFILIILFNIFLILFNAKINLLEKNILLLFQERINLVPSIYEITKKYYEKHQEVFFELLRLRKIKINNWSKNFIENINNELKIHHELNFIFKIANRHPKIQKDEKFLLIRDLFLENAEKIWDKISLYKKIIKKFNYLLMFKNLTIIWIFIRISKKQDI